MPKPAAAILEDARTWLLPRLTGMPPDSLIIMALMREPNSAERTRAIDAILECWTTRRDWRDWWQYAIDAVREDKP